MATGISQIKNLKLSTIQISEIRQIATGVYILSFPKKSNFLAGQVIGITISRKLEPRLYSIASGETDDHIEILFDVKKDGKLTPELSILNPGDLVFISEPFGEFTQVIPNSYWIATGTGIAPFRSMIRSGKGASNWLIQGGRSEESFYFSEEFSPVLKDKYIRCSSSLKNEDYFSGRLTEWIRIKTQLDVKKDYFLCGSAEMVVNVRDLLIERDVPFKQIHAEIYF
jgi:ferredoxin/flavodoxin---NADP+ reductase